MDLPSFTRDLIKEPIPYKVLMKSVLCGHMEKKNRLYVAFFKLKHGDTWYSYLENSIKSTMQCNPCVFWDGMRGGAGQLFYS